MKRPLFLFLFFFFFFEIDRVLYSTKNSKKRLRSQAPMATQYAEERKRSKKNGERERERERGRFEQVEEYDSGWFVVFVHWSALIGAVIVNGLI